MEEADAEIIKKAKANARAFGELYRKYADRVYNYLWYRTGRQKDVAEDLMQETFLRAFRHLGRFQARGYSYLTYLLTIARNLLINYYRSKKLIPLSRLGDANLSEEVLDALERRIALKNLRKAVRELSPVEREVVQMYYRKEMPIKEISRIIGRSENAVKLILSRARKKLAKHPYIQDLMGPSGQRGVSAKPRLLKIKKL